MKIAVFADSHADSTLLFSAVEAEKPDAVIHLGDHIEDGSALSYAFPGLPLHLVRGNTDASGPGEALLSLSGKRAFLTHGHLYGVKNGVYEIAQKGRALGADIVLFGHTHKPLLTLTDGLWLINPGHAGRKERQAGRPTYAILRIEQGLISASLIEGDE